MAKTNWIELEGADNVRDVGGLPTADGAAISAERLIRADSLQALTDNDVRRLVDEFGVRDVVDLRSGVEVAGEGDGPMLGEVQVEVTHLSLLTEPEHPVEVAPDGPVILPWQERDRELTDVERRRGVSAVYLRYLHDRTDSVLAALRTIAHSEGATLVHCAAGKDRTGVIVALALAEVGVDPQPIAADYALSADRVQQIYRRLAQRRTYANEMTESMADLDRHKPRAETMIAFFETMDEEFGGAGAWLRAQGWTEDDAAALRHKLLD